MVTRSGVKVGGQGQDIGNGGGVQVRVQGLGRGQGLGSRSGVKIMGLRSGS